MRQYVLLYTYRYEDWQDDEATGAIRIFESDEIAVKHYEALLNLIGFSDPGIAQIDLMILSKEDSLYEDCIKVMYKRN